MAKFGRKLIGLKIKVTVEIPDDLSFDKYKVNERIDDLMDDLIVHINKYNPEEWGVRGEVTPVKSEK